MSNPFVANSMSNLNMQNIRNIYQMLTNSRNPMQLFNNLAMQNPQLKGIAQMLSGGASPQQIFNDLCQQRGINPQDFINQITNNNT